ncbi:MAG: hypothetical protein SOX56_03155 [[Pasteurella] mairii]|uniref:Uncharacterized protein n=1 Tax=[Pasteurella] mairii TaxID=757 RepID=A0A379B781_9PAST|nr:hypothetical protein [[Pasteurella] mairii]SUB33950.1 Uncharacterised protein [[Pasteurella] mairii]
MMNATHFTVQIQQRYGIKAQYPWENFPIMPSFATLITASGLRY